MPLLRWRKNLFNLWFSSIMFAFSFANDADIVYTRYADEGATFLCSHFKSHTNNENSYCEFSDLMEFKFERENCKYFSGFSSLIRFCWENILRWWYLKNNIEWNLHFNPQRDEWRKSIKNLFSVSLFPFHSALICALHVK